MTLLEQTYIQLKQVGLINCAEEFSRDYLNKNSNWFAYQKHTGRDYSMSAAIHCLRTIRFQQRNTAITTAQAQALKNTEQKLLAHLNAQYCVADVC